MKNIKDKKIKIRIPLPLKKGGAHSKKKGSRGYDRKRDKKNLEKIELTKVRTPKLE